MYTRKGSSAPTQEAMQPGQERGVRDQKRTTRTRPTFIRKGITSSVSHHIEPELSTKLTYTSADTKSKGLPRTEKDIISSIRGLGAKIANNYKNGLPYCNQQT